MAIFEKLVELRDVSRGTFIALAFTAQASFGVRYCTSRLPLRYFVVQAFGVVFVAAHLAFVKADFPGVMILAWGMRNAVASSHRFLSESPLAANQPGSLALNRQDDAANEHRSRLRTRAGEWQMYQ